jgi:signal transduction histidine kinase
MRATANPAALAASDVFGDRLRGHLEVLTKVLRPHLRRLEKRFLERLRRLGYDPRQRKALAAITPGAAAAVISAHHLPPDFIEQTEYNGRRLAKLKLAPARIMHAFQEYDQLLAPLALALKPDEGARFRQALEQWSFCVSLTLNNASYQVAEAETLTHHEMFKNELESGSLDELLARMLESLGRFCRAQAGSFFLREQGTSRFRRRAVMPRPKPDTPQGQEVAVSSALLRRLAKERCLLAGRDRLDLALDPSWQGQYRTCWSVPLLETGRVTGVMQFGFSRPYEWLPREVELLSAAAERCLLAVGKARLVEDLAAREAQVRQLAGHMFQVEERERRRISSELHDEAGQSLLWIRLQLEMIENSLPESCAHLRQGLKEARAITEKAIVEIRRLIAALSPAVLEELGLGSAIRQLATRLRRLHKMQVRLHVTPLRDLPSQTASAVYRLVQECLNNVARHSSASCVNISVDSADEELRLSVEDDGVGFCVQEAQAKRGSLGLAGMSERVALLGGELHVTSRPGRGTRVLIELPIRGKRGNKPREVE